MKNTRKETWYPTTTTMNNLMFLSSGAKISAIPNRNVAPMNDMTLNAVSRTPRHCNTQKAMFLILILITTIGTVRRYVFGRMLVLEGHDIFHNLTFLLMRLRYRL